MIPLMIAAAAAQGTLGYLGQQGKNAAIERAMLSAKAATDARISQIRAATSQKRGELFRRSRQILGQTIVNAGAAGLSLDGSVSSLAQQIAVDAGRADMGILSNDQANVAAAGSEYQAQTQSLAGQAGSPIMAAFQGGVQGLQLGLQIQGGMDAFNRLNATRAAPAATATNRLQIGLPSYQATQGNYA